MKEIDFQDYLDTIASLIDKKSASIQENNDYTKKQKIIRYMLQKGYEYELVKEYLNQ